MVNAKQAYEKIKKDYPISKLLACVEFGDFFLFNFAPMLENTDDGYYTGTEFPIVNKKTGEISLYDITSDVDAYESAKPVKIETIMDKVVRV